MQCRILLSAFLLLTLTFCSSSPQDEIGEVLKRRERALEQGDLALYLSCVSKDYQDKGKDFSVVGKKVARSIDSLKGIKLSFSDRSIYINGDIATVYQKVELSVDTSGKKKHFSDRERLTLAKEEGGWKIIKGL